MSITLLICAFISLMFCLKQISPQFSQKPNQNQQRQFNQSNKISSLRYVILQNHTSKILTMPEFKLLILVFIELLLLTNCAQIQIGHNDVTLLQKRKVYCSMISYHFLDNDMNTFIEFTSEFSQLRSKVFKAKVATKLSDNCQQKITNQQLIELSRLIERPKDHEDEIQSLEHKYIQYFTPQENIVLTLLQQVKEETDLQLKNEAQKYNQARKEIEEHTRVVITGFKDLKNHINKTGHHAINGFKNLYHSLFNLHGNFTQGWNKFQEGLAQSVQNMKGSFSSEVEQLNAHSHVQKVKDLWNGLWGEDL